MEIGVDEINSLGRKTEYFGLHLEPQPIEIDADDCHHHHLWKNFEYINENIPGPAKEAEIASDERFYQFCGCDCPAESSCSEINCSCMLRFGPGFDSRGRLMSISPFETVMRPVLECHSQCKCNDLCRNRVVQNGVKVKLKIFLTKKKGLGIKTLESIEKNKFVCEYVGEILSVEEAEQRTRLLSSLDTNFIMTVNEYLECGTEVTYIDPTYKGNVGRFINHSCNPNLFLIPVRVDHSYPRVAMFALKDIDVEEELSYDYCYGFNCLSDTPEPSLSTNAGSRCHCESVNCREYLPVDSSLHFSS